MSGICGIVNIDGVPIDRHLLEEMTKFMAFRGPDAQDVWIDGTVGFGHTMLRTTFESEREQQPISLDGKVWITADARIDGGDELKNKIAARGRGRIERATDAELILHAYHAWGEDCLKHLIGDFAFAIWDGPRKRLFCARDHFGVKPFFYARIGQCLIFSNTLDCVRKHPAVSATLNELAIADFLLFDMNQDPATTAFADIQRLPPARNLTWSAKGLKLNRYWTLPADGEVRYRAAGDYVECFRELLGIAIADRLRTRQVTVSMSGGLDSTAIAVTAKSLLARQSAPFELHAYTVVYDRLIPDEERYFAGMAAHMLGIPIHYRVADDYRLYEQFDQSGTHFPEPHHEPDGAASFDALRAQAARCRVMLTGWDGDALLNESPKPYFRKLLKELRVMRLLGGMVRYAMSERRLLPLGVRAWLTLGRPASSQHVPSYPAWLNPDLEKRFALRARWDQANAAVAVRHTVRPYAHRIFAYLTQMSNFFDRYDSGVTRLPLECRHPLLDLRLVDYCLSLPPLPWCVKKEILRVAMRGLLPEPVRLRPKTPLAGWPGAKMLREANAQWIDRFVSAPDLNTYVDREKIPKIWGGDYPHEAWTNLRPLSLNFWLQNQQSAPPQSKGRCYESA